MTSISVHLEAWGNETGGVPVMVKVLDSALRLVHEQWVEARTEHRFDVEPGMYLVRGSLPSGRKLEQVVQVAQDEDAGCSLPLHDLSPHETHEWAYLTKSIDAPGTGRLSQGAHSGVWLRLWHREPDGTWAVAPMPGPDSLSREEDGVSYGFQAPSQGQYLLQAGGPSIPWKFAAIPSSYPSMVLIRPSAASAGAAHPLDLCVASNDWDVESLLSLMQRGDTDLARDLMERRQLATRLLYSKRMNTNGAAVGGYFLLRVGELGRASDWPKNLADWFEWFSDGAIIRAWQLIAEARREEAQRDDKYRRARQRLLDAVHRGLPLYSEGLRLLRDGLLLFDSWAKQEDRAVREALEKVGAYTAVCDWSATTTTFTGRHPDDPAPWSITAEELRGGVAARAPMGVPHDDAPLLFAYDVPLDAAVAAGALDEGESLRVEIGGAPIEVRVDRDGKIEATDGKQYESLAQAQGALGEPGRAYDWRVARTGDSLADLVRGLRLDL